MPSESVFIDDNADNVAASIREGMPAIRFVGAKELERELKEVYGLEF